MGINHSPRLDFGHVIPEIIKENNKATKNSNLYRHSSPLNRDHINWVKPLNSQAGLTNCIKCIWGENRNWVTEQGRKRSIIPPPVPSLVAGKQYTCYQQKPKHLLRSEAFKSAADDDKRLFMAASVGLRFAVEVDRLLAV